MEYKGVLIIIIIAIVTAIALMILALLVKLPASRFVTQTLKTRNANIHVFVADTLIKRQAGLSGWSSLDDNTGMLFLFPKANIPVFWMKGMKFPLDVVWIYNNHVVDISYNIPPPDGGVPATMKPSQAVDEVLEINAGQANALDIHIGDTVTIGEK